MSVVPPPLAPLNMAAGPSSHGRNVKPSKLFDVVAAYKRALGDHSVSSRVSMDLELSLMSAGSSSNSRHLGSGRAHGGVQW